MPPDGRLPPSPWICARCGQEIAEEQKAWLEWIEAALTYVPYCDRTCAAAHHSCEPVALERWN